MKLLKHPLLAVTLSLLAAARAYAETPTVTTLPASGMSNAVATLNGTVNPNGLTTTAWFEWGTSTFDYSQQTTPVAVGNGSAPLPLNSYLTGLMPGVMYRGRMAASNGVGVARGGDVRFGSPVIALNSAALLTNECHSAFADPATASFGLLAVDGGYYHSLAVKGDGTVTGWGYNNFGQATSPVGLSNVVAATGGDFHTVALKSDGTVVAWGAGLINNPGDGINFGQSIVPVGLSNVMAIAAGEYFNLALKRDGTVAGWGDNSAGQTTIPVDLSNVVAIAAGEFHSLAVKSDGTAAAWGYNNLGQSTIPAGLSNVVAVAGGLWHTLVLKSDGTVAAWGNNGYGQTTIPVGLSNVVAIAAGERHNLALKRDGTVVAWGYNSQGQTTVPVGLSNVVAIAARHWNSLALESDGTVAAWGYGTFGQTGVPAGLGSILWTVSGGFDTNAPGSYPLTYTSTNFLGGIAAPATRTVVVVDTLPPILTMPGKNLILITNVADLPLVDPGATAVDLCGGILAVSVSNAVNVNFPGTYVITYRATDASGNTAAANRTVVVALPPSVPGDQNGDGIVSQAELDAVYARYVTNSPWLYMTNVAGLGGTNVTFALSNSVLGAYTIEYSTNLTNWQPLGPATPRYLFTDTNAPAAPQRSYRLRYP